MRGEDTLRDIDDEDLLFVPQEVIFAEVGVHEVALAVQSGHESRALRVGGGQVLFGERRLLQGFGGLSLFADESHDEHVFAQNHDFGTENPVSLHSVLKRSVRTRGRHVVRSPDCAFPSRPTKGSFCWPFVWRVWPTWPESGPSRCTWRGS